MLTARTDDSSSDAHSIADRPRTPAEARADRIARAVLLAIGVAVFIATLAGAGLGTNGSADSSESGARLGGDFPAFYGAGSIVWSGDIENLYNTDRQEAAQDALGLDGYLAFAYPPHVAVAYSPLSALDFQLAYVVHTALMAAALVGALYVLADLVPLVRRWRWPLAAAGLTFFPVFTAVGGGQNAPLTLLLLAVVWRSLADDRQVVAGVATGLLLFRPQYAIPVLGLLFLARHWRAVQVGALIGLATWAGTAIMLGPSWVTTWFDEVIPFVERDAEVNAANSISILGFLQAAWGADARPAVVIGALGAAMVVLTLMALWSRPHRFALADRMGALAIGITLISPHTMFYDATLLLLAGVAVLWRVGLDGTAGDMAVVNSGPRILALVWLAALLHLANDGLGATPLSLVVIVSFVLFVIDAVRRGGASSGDAPLADVEDVVTANA